MKNNEVRCGYSVELRYYCLTCDQLHAVRSSGGPLSSEHFEEMQQEADEDMKRHQLECLRCKDPKEHQYRVLNEKKELDDRLNRLLEFMKGSVFSNLPKDEQALLTRQSLLMGGYSEILSRRIAAFK